MTGTDKDNLIGESSAKTTATITCLKTLLMVFNIIFWVSGLAIVAVGVWMKVQLYMFLELTSLYHPETPYVLIGIGGGIILFGLFGCCCTIKEKGYFLYTYAGILFLVFILELTLGVSGFLYRGKFEGGFQSGLADAINDYATDEHKKETLDTLQDMLHCCGEDSYEDWFSVAWDGSAPSNSVPKSCCKSSEAECQNTDLTSTDDINTEGCFSKITSFMETNFGIIGGVAIGFSFFQLFGCIFAYLLAKKINKNQYEAVH